MRLEGSFARAAVLTAALFMAAACETAQQDSGAATGQGAQTAAAGQPATSSGTEAPRETVQQAVAPQIRPGSQEDLVQRVGDTVGFATDRSDLSPEARRTVGNWADWLKQYPSVTATIEGHADERGTREYNLALGDRRAASVRSYLVALGVAPNRVETLSYGKERPTCVQHDDTCWSKNRRGVMRVN